MADEWWCLRGYCILCCSVDEGDDSGVVGVLQGMVGMIIIMIVVGVR